jgi:hypothetical protein
MRLSGSAACAHRAYRANVVRPREGTRLALVADAMTHSSTTRPLYWVLVCAFVAIAGYFLWQDHRERLLGALPYVLLLACPFMHLLMHRGHGGRDSHREHHS